MKEKNNNNLITETLKKITWRKKIVGPRSSILSEDSINKILELIKKI